MGCKGTHIVKGRQRLLPGLGAVFGLGMLAGQYIVARQTLWQGWRIDPHPGHPSALRRLLLPLPRLLLAARPAAEKAFAHAPPSRWPPLRLPSVLMLTGWPNRSVSC